MIINVLQVIAILAIFVPIRYAAYQVTDVWGLPKWLDYKPFNCCLCLTFWMLLAFYLTVGLIFKMYITLFGGIALTILNAIAMYVDQKNKTVSLDEWNDE